MRGAGPQDRGSKPQFGGVLPGSSKRGSPPGCRPRARSVTGWWSPSGGGWRWGAGRGGTRRGGPPGHPVLSGGHGEAAVSPGTLSPPRLSGPDMGQCGRGRQRVKSRDELSLSKASGVTESSSQPWGEGTRQTQNWV